MQLPKAVVITFAGFYVSDMVESGVSHPGTKSVIRKKELYQDSRRWMWVTWS
jgi:hypothetical protein